jgi:hypothetical protein
VTEEKRETAELVLCEGCQQMIHPLTEHAVSLVAATVVTVHGCPSCGGRRVSVARPSLR